MFKREDGMSQLALTMTIFILLILVVFVLIVIARRDNQVFYENNVVSENNITNENRSDDKITEYPIAENKIEDLIS